MENENEMEPLDIEQDVSIALKEIAECFSLFDKGSTGNIPSKHFEHALKALGIHLTSTEIRDASDEIEKNGKNIYPHHKLFINFSIKIKCR